MRAPGPYVVHRMLPGRLAMMSHPPGGAWLESALGRLRGEHRVDLVICALTDEELQLLDLTGGADAVRRAGMRFEHFPIPDRDIPEFEPYRELTARLAAEVEAGSYVVAHCWAGIGRSGLLAGGTLVQLGMSAPQAMDRLEQGRGLVAPETAAQRDMLVRLAETVASAH